MQMLIKLFFFLKNLSSQLWCNLINHVVQLLTKVVYIKIIFFRLLEIETNYCKTITNLKVVICKKVSEIFPDLEKPFKKFRVTSLLSILVESFVLSITFYAFFAFNFFFFTFGRRIKQKSYKIIKLYSQQSSPNFTFYILQTNLQESPEFERKRFESFNISLGAKQKNVNRRNYMSEKDI